MSSQRARADREYYVVKANDLIRKTRYNLTTQQQQIVLFAISRIKKDDDARTVYTFDIKELADAFGWKIRESGYYYDSIKEDLTTLAKPFWIRTTDENGKVVDRMISWINSDAEMRPGDSTIKITFNKNIQPYLFELNEKYTQYKINCLIGFRGKYAIRLYELLKSYTIQRKIDILEKCEIEFSLNEMRYLLDIEGQYETWQDLDRRVIKPATSEINELADDIHVEYKPMREKGSRAYQKIVFITSLARAKQMLHSHEKRKEKLSGKKKTGRRVDK